MNVTGFVFNLNSPQPDRLQEFYRDVIGLKPNPQMGEGALIAAGTPFIIDGHSDLTGASREPARVLTNFMVDDVAAEKARLEALGVPFLGPPSDDVISFATFIDPDGNYGQVYSMQGAPAGSEGFALARHTADPDRLRSFWRDVIGLSDDHPEIGNPFMAGETSIYISPHSEVKGPVQEPARFIFNLFVEDIAAEQARMEAAGVRFIRTQGKEYWGGIISTFVAPDGSYMQLIEFRPDEATQESGG